MALDKNDFEQIRGIVREEVYDQITSEVPAIVESKIYPLKNDLQWIKNKLKQFEKMETEDIRAAYTDIANLKKKVKQLEIKIEKLELAR